MNKLLHNLHWEVIRWNGNGPDCPDDYEWGMIPEAYTEKFAELIIKECAKHIDSKLSFADGSGECMSWAEGSDLLKHFGIDK